jgi:dTDP-4-dehydrorhamnose reductase
MYRVAVLGTTGMLGRTVTGHLREKGFFVQEFNRRGASKWQNFGAVKFSVDERTTMQDLKVLASFDVVINSLGLIKQVIDESNEGCVLQSHLVNSYFPMLLNQFSVESEIPVLQIGTDCVFSGTAGKYTESSEQQYTDLYSFTKCVGENLSLETNILRTSVIGCEIESKVSLLSWVLSQEKNSKINGYSDHHWNGLTSLHFSKIAAGVISSENFQSGIRHVVPANIVTKEQLVKNIAENFGRSDVEIIPFNSGNPIDRSLDTVNIEENLKLWKDAGYDEPPTIEEMIVEYAEWEKSTTLSRIQ